MLANAVSCSLTHVLSIILHHVTIVCNPVCRFARPRHYNSCTAQNTTRTRAARARAFCGRYSDGLRWTCPRVPATPLHQAFIFTSRPTVRPNMSMREIRSTMTTNQRNHDELHPLSRGRPPPLPPPPPNPHSLLFISTHRRFLPFLPKSVSTAPLRFFTSLHYPCRSPSSMSFLGYLLCPSLPTLLSVISRSFPAISSTTVPSSSLPTPSSCSHRATDDSEPIALCVNTCSKY